MRLHASDKPSWGKAGRAGGVSSMAIGGSPEGDAMTAIAARRCSLALLPRSPASAPFDRASD